MRQQACEPAASATVADVISLGPLSPNISLRHDCPASPPDCMPYWSSRRKYGNTTLRSHLDRHRIAVDDLSAYYEQPKNSQPGLVIGYATPAEHAFHNNLAALINALGSFGG